jgi:hypothetical protein
MTSKMTTLDEVLSASEQLSLADQLSLISLLSRTGGYAVAGWPGRGTLARS